MPTLHKVDQRSEDWHKLREGKITASNAWKLLQYGKAKALEPSDFTGNIWTERGTILESEAIELYERVKDTSVLTVGFVTNDEYPDCGASPDGVAGDTLIEVKCFNKDKHLSIHSNAIPFEVMAQVQFSMMVCDLDKCHLVLYNPDLDAEDALRIIEIEKDHLILLNIKSKLNDEP